MNKEEITKLLKKKGIIFHHFLDGEDFFALVLKMPKFTGFGVYSVLEAKVVIPMKYDDVYCLSDEIFIVEKNEKFRFFSIKTRKFAPSAEIHGATFRVEDHCLMVKKGEKKVMIPFT